MEAGKKKSSEFLDPPIWTAQWMRLSMDADSRFSILEPCFYFKQLYFHHMLVCPHYWFDSGIFRSFLTMLTQTPSCAWRTECILVVCGANQCRWGNGPANNRPCLLDGLSSILVGIDASNGRNSRAAME